MNERAANERAALERARQESALHYPLGPTLPAPGSVVDVAPGVRWLRMALPFALDHINLWLLRDRLDNRDGWTVVDCGIDNADTRARWQQVFDTALQGLPVLRVICTHMHPDHIGLAHWLCKRWGTAAHDCRLWISSTDWHAARVACHADTAFSGEGAAHFFARHGLLDEAALQQVRARTNYYGSLVPQVPRQYRRLLGGMVLPIGGQAWHCISGYGHAPEHIALHAPGLKVLIAGDMVLPRISTNVSVIDMEPEGDPLPLYLESIAQMLPLPADTLVLPSHGKPFVGLHTRIAQLQAHHDERFADVLQACAVRPCSAADLLPVLFKRMLDLHQTTFAMGEAVAHVHALLGRGQLRAASRHDGVDDGVLRFSSVSASTG
ncbi:MAG: MBL fold metallo-hydrolase [Rubrivivax sp.]|nr:MBL fold metallo-hydrolase [Rubrivivax sp.]